MNTSTFVGNLAGDPKLVTSRGGERAIFSIALDEYSKDEEAPPTYVDITVFSGKKDAFARNVAESLTKGKRVVVVGRASTYKIDVEIDGEEKKVTKTSFVATAVAPDLRWQSAKVTKVTADRDDEEERPARSNGRSRRGSDDEADERPPARTKRSRTNDEDADERPARSSRGRKAAADDEDDF